MNAHLLLKFLFAFNCYGPSAHPVTYKFCQETLDIPDVDKAIADLRKLGHLITVTENGEIRLGE